MFEVIIKAGRERSLLRRHPWVFSGAVETVTGSPPPGATVKLLSSAREFLGYGAWSPASQIRIRMWSFAPEAVPGADLWRRRISDAVALRHSLGFMRPGEGCRLINGESDGFPGLIVDRYDRFLVCQFLSAGAELWKNDIIAALDGHLAPSGIYERSDASAREKDGMECRCGVLLGAEPPEFIRLMEDEIIFDIDVRRGHKTGFYLDQRGSRRMVADACGGGDVLNCFSYTGAFSAWALSGGAASVTDIDASEYALQTAAANYRNNGFSPDRYEQICGDAFVLLRKLRDRAKNYDVIILDPPKFAENPGHLQRASRAYKDINLLAFKLLRPGGRLFTFSCSGAMSADLFAKIVADAALDAGRDAVVLRRPGQGADHPVALNFPEGAYLKGLEISVC